MTVQEAKIAADALAKQITVAVQAYEKATGCTVHSIPVHNDGKNPPFVVVKVQI